MENITMEIEPYDIISYNDFLKFDKQKMYNFIHNSYFKCSYQKDYQLVIKCCMKFLKLFYITPYTYYDKHYNENDLKHYFMIQFLLASSYHKINDITNCLSTYEIILGDNRCPQDIKEWSLYNSGLLYNEINSKQDFSIPRIIHVLFFGFTPFEHHHYRCLKSMLHHMCDLNREEQNRYSLFIHTVFDSQTNEPILNNKYIDNNSNTYWKEIISHPSVRLIQAKVPEEIDGFPLNYFQYKADIYRIDVLFKYGGIYLDADLLLIKHFDDLISSNKYSFYICDENPRRESINNKNNNDNDNDIDKSKDDDFVINAFIASTPGNPVLTMWKKTIPSRIRNGTWANHIRVNHAIWRDNPYRIAKYGINVLPNTHFFDISWQESNIWKCNQKPIIKEQHYGFHLWETILNDDCKSNIFLPSCEYRNEEKIPIHKLFDKVYIIGTEDAQDRLQDTILELTERALIPKEKVIIKSNPRNNKSPAIGCRQAHIDAIKFALEHNLSSIMIVEDDIAFQHITDLSNTSYTISKPPLDYDILYLGGILTNFISGYSNQTNSFYNSYDNNFGWIKGTIWCNHAYIVRKHMYKPILELYEKFINKLAEMSNYDCKNNNIQDVCPSVNIDHFYTYVIQERYKCYLDNSQSIIQKPDKNGKWTINDTFNWNTFSMKVIPDSNSNEINNLNINWKEI